MLDRLKELRVEESEKVYTIDEIVEVLKNLWDGEKRQFATAKKEDVDDGRNDIDDL